LRFRRRREVCALFALPILALGAKKKKSADLYAIVGGTVFRDPGFALAGAQVLIEPEQEVVNGSKLKAQKAVSDARGEFAFRVAPISAKYRITVKAQGMVSQTKPAATNGGEERIDVTFTLQPASN
jgi:hypothetical protein